MASRYRTRATSMPATRRLAARHQRERRQHRWVLALAVAVVLVVLALPAYGYYQTFIAPPRRSVAQVNEIKHTLGDLVKRTKANVRTSVDFGAQPQLATVPFEALNTMVEEELLRQGAASAGIIVTQDDIDAEIRKVHYPNPPAGEQADPAALEKEFQEKLRSYLNLTQFSETEYRNIIKAQIIKDRLREQLSEQLPAVEEQVYVHWIKLLDANQAEEITQRLDNGDSFESLARIYSQNDPYADDNGEVGWVPRGAFPGLDPTLFSIEHNVVSEAVTSGSGTFLIKVTDGPVTSEINDKMREVLKTRAVQQWLNDQRDRNNVQVNFGSDDYAWVIDKVRESASSTPAG